MPLAIYIQIYRFLRWILSKLPRDQSAPRYLSMKNDRFVGPHSISDRYLYIRRTEEKKKHTYFKRDTFCAVFPHGRANSNNIFAQNKQFILKCSAEWNACS